MASFWDWRGSSASVTASTPGVEPVALEPVELYTRHAMVLGRVEPDGQRLSDILNSNSQLPVRDARSISLLNGLEGTDSDGWTSVSTDDILLAMPPERASPRQLRINRRQHRVRIETGPYAVVGTAHVLPGTKLDPYVLRSRMRFLALTQVHVTSKSDPSWERTAPVVLVNVRPLKDLAEVVTIS